MSRMIKLTDSLGAELEKRAKEDHLSMAGEIAKLLSLSNLSPSPVDTNYFDKKFAHLESLIEDSLVDVVAAGNASHTSHSHPQDNDILDWDVFRYIVFDLCKDDDSPEWVSQSVHDAMDNLNDPITTIVLDGYIWAVNDYGKSKLLKVSPRVEEAIREGRCYE